MLLSLHRGELFAFVISEDIDCMSSQTVTTYFTEFSF